MGKKIYGRILNTKALPYNLTADKIVLKIELLTISGDPSYLSGVTIKLYSNVTGTDAFLSEFITDEFGTAIVEYSTTLISNKEIDTAQMWITFTYDGDFHISNKVRVNFVYDEFYELSFLIVDTNSPAGRAANPSIFYTYDADGDSTRNDNVNQQIIDRGIF